MDRCALLLLSGCLLFSVLGDIYDCPYKECYCGDDVIFCNDRSLKAIPEINDTRNIFIEIVQFDDNQITTVPAGSLLGNLSEISLTNNPIETIDDDAFNESIKTLQTLTFTRARFTQLPRAVLQLKVLNRLTIYQTNILVWDNEAMKQLGSTMEALNLDTVGLTTWPAWIQSYTHLTELTISGSSISSLPDDALDLVANSLTSLSLSNNSLTTVPKTLSKLTVLSSLSLDHNKITDITWLPQLCNLSSLLMNNNKLSDASKLSSALRVHANTLYNFGIHDNFLTSIPDLDFLTQIISLDLTNNHISDPIAGSLPSGVFDLQITHNFLPSIPRMLEKFVFQLYLSSNRISVLQGTYISPQTTGADFGYNLITGLTRTSFPENSNLTFVILNNNPISDISLDAFNNLAYLEQLHLQHSKLTRLPLAIASLTRLSMIDVTGSTQLVCTCMEKGLEPTIKAMWPGSAMGNCGHTSLSKFFTELSPDCPVLF